CTRPSHWTRKPSRPKPDERAGTWAVPCQRVPCPVLEFRFCWRRGREVEGTPLLREHAAYTRIEGSNPSVSASKIPAPARRAPKPAEPPVLRVFLWPIGFALIAFSGEPGIKTGARARTGGGSCRACDPVWWRYSSLIIQNGMYN